MPLKDGAPGLLRGLGLSVDGPARWGRLPQVRGPGVFLVDAPRPLKAPAVDPTVVRRWIEAVPTLRLDGERPTVAQLEARLAELWLPGETVLYVGRSDKGLAGRVAALYATPLGQRRPHPGGHWLKTLRDLEALRIWWAETEAAEEYEDAILGAFAEAVPPEVIGGLPARYREGVPVLPWANLESPTGGARPTGITGALLSGADGTEGSRGAPASPRSRAGTRPLAAHGSPSADPSDPAGPGAAASPARRRVSRAPVPRTVRPRAARPSTKARPTHLTAQGLETIRAELSALVETRRPEVVARVRQARELGDLRENADYEAARNEQAFLEGRIRDLEQRLRTAVVVSGPSGGTVALGSTVRYELDGEIGELTIVGSAESAPGAGRISASSPVGKALLGHRAGDEVAVRTPAAESRYRIIEVR